MSCGWNNRILFLRFGLFTWLHQKWWAKTKDTAVSSNENGNLGQL